MILSYHPILEGDVNRICAGRDPDASDYEAMRRASAILLPQGCRMSLFEAASRCCRHVFPDHSCCFRYPGKLGDIRLFRAYGYAHPRSWLFGSVAACPCAFWESRSYPLVLKSNYGGEGTLVFELDSPRAAQPLLHMFRGMEKSDLKGFLAQEYIQTDGRDLRVVVMGDRLYSYWKIRRDGDAFYHNVSRGAVIDKESDPLLQQIGRRRVGEFCRGAGIDLAGFDLLFPCEGGEVRNAPLFLEINYYFGRQGLGGGDQYYRLLRETVDRWLEKTLTDRYPPPTGGKKATRSVP